MTSIMKKKAVKYLVYNFHENAKKKMRNCLRFAVFLPFVMIMENARDHQLFELIEAEHQRQLCGLELIASENFTSP